MSQQASEVKERSQERGTGALESTAGVNQGGGRGCGWQ